MSVGPAPLAPFGLTGFILAVAVFATAMAAALFLRKYDRTFNRRLAAVCFLLGVIQLGNAIGAADSVRSLDWRRLVLVAELWLPTGLLAVGLSLLQPLPAQSLEAAQWRLRAIVFLSALFSGVCFTNWVMLPLQDGRLLVTAGPIGRGVNFFIVLSFALALGLLESILRVSRDPVRYELKYVIIGLGAIAGYQIYEASERLLMPVWAANDGLVSAATTAMSLALIAYGLGRRRLHEFTGRVYVSPQILYGSVSFVIVGLYLLATGMLAQWIRVSGQSLGESLSTLLIFVGAVALVILLSSRKARVEFRRFVVRHFYRSKYDYRLKWLEVTDALRRCDSVDSILDQLLNLLSRTFSADRLSIWMRYDADGYFHQVRSTNIEAAPPPLDGSLPMILELNRTDDPVACWNAQWSEPQGQAMAAFWESTRAVLAVPMRSGNELLGFIALSREREGQDYGADDCDLLRAIGHHAAVLLAHAYLAEERHTAASFEALHKFTAFCLHDLKNLTARLSLVAQNAAEHGQDPAFQRAAMKTVSGTVEKMTALMTKLSVGATSPGDGRPMTDEAADVRATVVDIIENMNEDGSARVQFLSEEVLPPVRMRQEQLHQVLLNILLNARQACSGSALIRVSAAKATNTVQITISDNGPGIPGTVLRTLFQPFRTTKSGGLGVGLYQCRRMVESQQGSLRVESQVGQGTRVHIRLPCLTEAQHAVHV